MKQKLYFVATVVYICLEKRLSQCELLVFQALESRKIVLRKGCASSRLRICDLFKTLFLLEKTGKRSNEHWEKI